MSTPDTQEFQSKLQRLETLLHQTEHSAEPIAPANVREIVQSLLELHATGIERILDHVVESGEPGDAILSACINDEMIGGLLLLHGLHPVAMEDRVEEALEQVRPYLRTHGGDVELIGIEEGIVSLRFDGSCDDCPSSASTMRRSVEEAIYAKAPDIAGVKVEGEADWTFDLNGAPRIALPVM